jgi:transglutaminase/protease-like cytokinesis protein 3
MGPLTPLQTVFKKGFEEMKKIISVALSLVLTLLLTVNAFATGYTKMKITEKTYAFANANESSDKLATLNRGYIFTPIGSTASYWKIEFVVNSVKQSGYVFKEHARELEVDTALILNAYRSGQYDTLTGKNSAVLKTCVEVINNTIKPDMSNYDKELAIHDWIIEWADYDTEVVNRSPNAKPNPDNDNPYGVLVGRRGVCDGYSTTFKLFMDMLGIECITVLGSSFEGQDEITVRGIVFNNLDVHGWNMVKLDGEWYCVDLSWNDIFDDNEVNRHYYFNVTSDLMRKTNHQWDDSKVPEATATTYKWR